MDFLWIFLWIFLMEIFYGFFYGYLEYVTRRYSVVSWTTRPRAAAWRGAQDSAEGRTHAQGCGSGSLRGNAVAGYSARRNLTQI